jgi:hypothetical protein
VLFYKEILQVFCKTSDYTVIVAERSGKARLTASKSIIIFIMFAYANITARNIKRQTIYKTIRQFFSRANINQLNRSSGHIHLPGAFFLR